MYNTAECSLVVAVNLALCCPMCLVFTCLQANARPRFELMQQFVGGRDVHKQYSNPDFFFEEWLKAEMARQEEAAKIRAERKKEKGKGGGRKKKVCYQPFV